MPPRKQSPRRSEGRFSLGRLIGREASTGGSGAGLVHVSQIGAGDPILREIRRRAEIAARDRAA